MYILGGQPTFSIQTFGSSSKFSLVMSVRTSLPPSTNWLINSGSLFCFWLVTFVFSVTFPGCLIHSFSRATAGVCPCTRSPVSRWLEVLLEWPGGAGFGQMWYWAGLEWACPRQVSLAWSSGDAHWHHQQRSQEEGRQEDGRKRTQQSRFTAALNGWVRLWTSKLHLDSYIATRLDFRSMALRP